MKLIKINTDHYIIVDDSEIKEGDWVYHFNSISIFQYDLDEIADSNYKKITHSTQPDKGMDNITFISSREVKELLGEMDVEKHWEYFRIKNPNTVGGFKEQYISFLYGYNQALEDNKEKKYTEEDLRKIIEWLNKNYSKVEDELAKPYQDKGEDLYDGFFKDAYEEALKRAINSIQPKTEWEVEIVDGKLKLK